MNALPDNEPENNAADSHAVRVRERAILGCLWGTAVGDALGLPVEGLTKRRQARMVPDLTRYHLLPGRGMVSDDTEHAWMVAHALLKSGGEPEAFGRSLARQLRWWLLGLPAGVGFATLRATLRLWIGIPYTRSGVFSAGNGPAMRSALLGVCYGHDPLRLRELVRISTRLTHTDPLAEAGALVVAVAAHLAATELATEASEPSPTPAPADSAQLPNAQRSMLDAQRSMLDALIHTALADGADGTQEFTRLVERVQTSVLAGQTTEDFAATLGLEKGVTGYVLHTVPVALHAWLGSPRDYERAVLGVIRCGGDTDTTAAIVGALVGATVGQEGIRADWKRNLWEWPRSQPKMTMLSRCLAYSSLTARPSRPVRINPLAILARNLFFLIIVLAHGFRRLLPPY